MHSASPVHGFRLTRIEGLFVLGIVLAWGMLADLLGKDMGWDFLNYHWYDAYAALHGRLGFDVAVGHHATYFNPLIHIPFYLLATLGSSWLAVFYLGALQGLNALPLYWMSRSALTPAAPRWSAPLLTVVGLCGSTLVSMIRKTSYDHSLLSALVLCGLAVVVVERERLRAATPAAARTAALAGLLVGLAVGLKPAEGPYAMGLALSLLLAAGAWRARGLRLAAAAAGGTAGVLLAGGFWFLRLWQYSGNPLFPFFNNVFGSPLIGAGSFMDARFIPHGLWQVLGFPLRFALDYRLADDVPFHDLRVPFLYVLIPLTAGLWLLGRRAREALIWPEVSLILLGFFAGTYAAWLRELAVYRYLMALELLAPLGIAAALGLWPWPVRARLGAIGLLLLVAAATGHYAAGPYARLGDPYVQVSALRLPHPEQTLILMTGYDPMAYLIPSLPPAIAVLRIQGWMAGPEDPSGLTRGMRARVASHKGDLFVLAAAEEQPMALKATAAYGLRIVAAQCQQLMTNLGGPYLLCPLERLGPGAS